MKRLVLVLGFAALAYASPLGAHAADPRFLITWKAQTYTPSWYEGKSFPVNNSYLNVAVSLVSQDVATQGKLIDLSQREVRWYLNGDQVTRGQGLTTLSIFNKAFPGSSIEVRVSAQHFDEEGKEYFVDETVTIPVVRPEVVVRTSSLTANILPNATVNIEAIPFFFTLPNPALQIEWIVDGTAAQNQNTNPFLFSISNKSDARVTVPLRVKVKNPQSSLETGETWMQFQTYE